MSPRTDSYLSLCLEQAAKSPLHYRHGSIIVNGGKVIGKGYNHYRPGFDGGALKTGQLASGSFDADAIATLKLKNKRKGKLEQQQSPAERVRFVPFEAANVSGGKGRYANTPLSMHSEMMAIYSVLSVSGTLTSRGSSRRARFLEKPCFKLPGRGKRQLRLRGLKSYVDTVCGEQTAIMESFATTGGSLSTQAARRGVESCVQQSGFEGAAYQLYDQERRKIQQQQRQRQQGVQRGSREREDEGSEQERGERRALVGRNECRVLPASGSESASSSPSGSRGCPPSHAELPEYTTTPTTV